MCRVQFVRFFNQLLVEPLRADAGFVAANQQDATSAGVERKGDSQHLAGRARPKLLHVRVLRAVERIGVRPAKTRPKQFQQVNFGNDLSLGVVVQIGESLVKDVGRFHQPHYLIIAYRLFLSIALRPSRAGLSLRIRGKLLTTPGDATKLNVAVQPLWGFVDNDRGTELVDWRAR